VLVSSALDPAIIDFGSVRIGPACTDPVVLELSAIFHPASPWVGTDWPSPAAALHWFDQDTYLEGCPFPDFVGACRRWAASPGVAAGDREIASVLLAQALRQYRYDKTPKDVARALIQAAMTRLA
jgi:hypothetical protein